MPAVWLKIDPGLADLYTDYVRGGRARRVHVEVQFEAAELSELEERGFDAGVQEDENRATGTVDLADVERLAEHPGVVRILYGRMPEPTLDVSVPQIRANQVWTFSGGAFGGATGAGAIVGIIDSGIDFRHPFFLRSTSPPTTRILRIWDPGLVPVAGESSPPSALLSGDPGTYGVEYKGVQINAVLRKEAAPQDPAVPAAQAVRHRDTIGHGTHVASIAAGNGRGPFKHIGVAPGADLVVAKLFDFEAEPQVGGAVVGAAKLFRDCVSYIRNVAASPDPGELRVPEAPKPVAINCSFGNHLVPHDGFNDEEDWVRSTFSGAGGRGKILVTAGGNAAGGRAHGRIEFPAAQGTANIPLDLFDDRTLRRSRKGGRWQDGTRTVNAQLFYPHGGPTLAAAVDVPGGGTNFIAGPALGGQPVTRKFAGRTLTINHTTESQILRDALGTIRRNLIDVKIEPDARNLHRTGPYTLRVTSSGQMTAHLWCTNFVNHGLRFDTKPAEPANVLFVEDLNLIEAVGGATNAITAGNYDAETASREIEPHSSVGPLVRYAAGGPLSPSKPDIAAPGVAVDAARSRDMTPALPGLTVSFTGVSMATPHVAGVVALMLEKSPQLTPAQTRTLLTAGVRPVAPPVVPVTANQAGAGRIDAKGAWDLTP